VDSPTFGRLQSAYRRDYFKETALTKMMDVIIEALDGGSVVALSSLDIWLLSTR
jgi:hypothetical protein